MSERIRLVVDGKPAEIDADPAMPLLYALRDDLGMANPKFGCGLAQCGACTVHIDGQPTRSCVTPVSAVAGKRITTIEGLSGEAGEAGPTPPGRPPGSPGWWSHERGPTLRAAPVGSAHTTHGCADPSSYT